VKLRSNFPRSACQAAAGSMPAGACLNILARSALTSTTSARRSVSSGARVALQAA